MKCLNTSSIILCLMIFCVAVFRHLLSLFYLSVSLDSLIFLSDMHFANLIKFFFEYILVVHGRNTKVQTSYLGHTYHYAPTCNGRNVTCSCSSTVVKVHN